MPHRKRVGDGYEVKGIKTFVDREKCRQVFRSEYDKLTDEISQHNDENLHVINYYGMGGIGKTKLLSNLVSNLLSDDPQAVYVKYDLEQGNSYLNFMLIVQSFLELRFGFKFKSFSECVEQYEQMTGLSVRSEKTKSAANTMFNMGVELLQSVLPGGETAVSVISGIKDVVSNSRSNHKVKIKGDMTPKEWENELIECFADDVNSNVSKLTGKFGKPIVFFIDTYEIYGSIRNSREGEANDSWLRLLIELVPYSLWIIMGREKLNWAESTGDAGWNDCITDCLVDRLDEKNSMSFLMNAGVKPVQLCRELYAVCNGLPHFLDLSVDLYYQLLNDGKTPQISDFGASYPKLVKRHLSYLDDACKIYIRTMAFLGKWDKEMFKEMFRKLGYSFNDLTYDRLIKYTSYITPACNCADGFDRMDRFISEVICKHFNDVSHEEYEKLYKAADEYIINLSKKFAGTENYIYELAPYISWELEIVFRLCQCDRNAAKQAFYSFSETVRPFVHDNYVGRPIADEILKRFSYCFEPLEEDEVTLDYMRLCGDYYLSVHWVDDEIRVREWIYNCVSNHYPKSSAEYFNALTTLIEAYIFGSEEQLEKAEELQQERRVLLGKFEDPPVQAYISSCLDSGIICEHLGNYHQAIKWYDYLISESGDDEEYEETKKLGIRMKAMAYLSMGDTERCIRVAEEYLARYTEISFANSTLLGTLRDAYVQAGNYDAAFNCDKENYHFANELYGRESEEKRQLLINIVDDCMTLRNLEALEEYEDEINNFGLVVTYTMSANAYDEFAEFDRRFGFIEINICEPDDDNPKQ